MSGDEQNDMSMYLAWPLKIRPEFNVSEAHVTLKYFGRGAVAKMPEIREIMNDKFSRLSLPHLMWRAKVFNVPGEPLVHVMELTGLDFRLFRLRQSLERLRQDDYPTWVPHITFERDVWATIVERKLQIEDVVESIGPLSLFIGGEVRAAFHKQPEFLVDEK